MPRFETTPRSTPVQVGERAPEFRLRHTFADEISLSERLAGGPVFLVFYVFDFGHY
jgi:peroxiredoxin